MAIRQFIILFFIYSLFLFAQEQGELYELVSIEFKGNSEISSSVLEKVIFSEATPWWFFKFLNSIHSNIGKPASYFDSSYIQIDINALQAYYKANGFFESKIAYSYEADSIDKEIYLTYIIEENQPFNYGSIRFQGLDSIPENISRRIYAETTINPNQKYEQAKTELNIAHILEILLNRGYMLVKHDSSVVYIDTIKNEAGLDIYFTTGRRYRISRTDVEKKGDGASYVSETLLRELTDIQEGGYFNNSQVRTSQARLVRTGLFHSINLSANKADTSGDYVPLKLEGSIGKMNEFLPGISMNNEFNYFNLGFNANYTRKNFLGEARKLSVTSEFAVIHIAEFNFKDFFSERNYNIDGYALINVKIEQPYLFRKPILGTLENYFQTSTLKRVNEKTYGLKTLFEFEMPYFTLINQLRPYYNLEFYHARIKDLAIEKDTILNSSLFTQTSFLGVQFGSAKANNLYFPTAGYNQLISLEAAVSNGESSITGLYYTDSTSQLIQSNDDGITFFYRIESTSTFYVPLSITNTSVFASKTKLGYVQAFSGTKDLIPGNRTFFAGGSNSIRGWGARDLPLLTTQNGSSLLNNGTIGDTTDNRDIYGGTFLLEGSLELRQRFLENVGVALFTDYGNVWNGYKMFRFDEVALASGFGIRYYSPIAPFRIDFGFKLYDPENKNFIWNNWNSHFFKNFTFHFGIGEAF